MPLAGLTETEKSKAAGALTVKEKVPSLVKPPPVPLMVIEWAPVGASLVVEIVTLSFEMQGGSQKIGEKLQETPRGGSTQEKLTGWAVPDNKVAVKTVLVSLP